MDSVWVLILFSGSMFFGCYFAGVMPLAVSFSENSLQLVSLVGAGLLVGTALSVIIPEGVNAMIAAAAAAASQASSSQAGVLVSESSSPAAVTQLHLSVGASLVIGFVFMLLVDYVTHRRSGAGVDNSDAESGSCVKLMPSQSPPLAPLTSQQPPPPCAPLSSPPSASSLPGLSASSSAAGVAAGSMSTKMTRSSGGRSVTATVGLVVHAAADGVALGAAVASSRADVEFIVFLAIMLHKAPAAFGLVSFLLQSGVDRRRARFHLFIFSVSAPAAAVLTYIFIVLGGGGGGESHAHATGVCLLLSGGTFLYVATVHVLSSVLHPQQHHQQQQGGLSVRQLLLLVTGCLLPLLLSFNHHH